MHKKRARLPMERGGAKPVKAVPFVIKILDPEAEELDIRPLTQYCLIKVVFKNFL
jgi:hypothetical protein